MSAGMILLGGGSPAGATEPVSQASGTVIGGSVQGVDLASLLSVQPATATNLGGATVTDAHPLDAAELQAADVDLGSGVNLLGTNSLLIVGAANQFAQANPDGSSSAASGAVTGSGAIGLGQGGVPQTTAELDLGPLLAGLGLSSTLSDVSISTGALAATAAQPAGGAQSGTYLIDGLRLDLVSPLVGGLTSGLSTVLGGYYPALVAGVGDVSTGGVTVNLATGAVTVDLAAVLDGLGLDLSSFTSATALMPYLIQALNTSLEAALTTALADLGTAIDAAVDAGTATQADAQITAATATLGPNVLAPIVAALPGLVSLEAGVTSNAGAAFTETALQIGIVPGSPALAEVDLASASVGPNGGPAVPSVASLSPADGPTAGGTEVTVSGTGFSPGSTVSVDGGAPITPDSISADGTSLTFDTPPHVGGVVAVTVSNATGASAQQDYTYDPPDPPAITAPGPTVTTSTPTVAGTGTPGDTVTVFDGASTLCTATVRGDGTWSCASAALSDGVHTITATQSDGVDSSAPSAGDPVVVDTAPTITALTPAQGATAGGTSVTVTGTLFTIGSTVSLGGGPPITPDAIAVDGTSLTFTTAAHAAGAVPVTISNASGTSAAQSFSYVPPGVPVVTVPPNGSTVIGSTPPISGSGTPGDVVTVSESASTICTAAVGPDGTFSCSPPPLANGTHTLTATQSDGTGTSAVSAADTFTVAPPAPGAPTISAVTPDYGPTAGHTEVTLAGSGFRPGSTVSLGSGPSITPDSISADATVLTFTTPRHAPGQVSVTVTSPAGPSGPQTFTYLPPVAPVITAPTPASTVVGDAPPIGGTGVAGNVVHVVSGASSGGSPRGAALCASVVASDGNWSCTSAALAVGVHTITATQSDGTATSAPSPRDTFTIVAAAPGSPTITALTPDRGATTGGATVAVAGARFTPGTTVTIDGRTVTPKVLSPRALRFTTPVHVAGPVEVTVINSAGPSRPILFTYVPPGAPQIMAPAPGSTTTSPRPPISGAGAAGDTVTVAEGTATVCVALVTAAGSWSCLPVYSLSDGQHTITASQGDRSDSSAASAPDTFTVAATPTPPVITSPVNGATVTSSTPAITGTGGQGDIVTVFERARTICTTVVRADSTWSCTPIRSLSDGTYLISAVQANPSGHLSAQSPAASFAVQTPISADGVPFTGPRMVQLIALGLLVLVVALVAVAGSRRRRA